MAEVLDKWPGGGRGNQKYPFDEWLDGRIWKLVRGTDFENKPSAIRSAAQSFARTRQWKLATSIPDENTLILQRVSPRELQPAEPTS